MDSQNQYQSLLTDLIKKQMIMLGPNIALAQARKVEGVTVLDDGTVTELSSNPKDVLYAVAKNYMALSGQIAQMTLESVIAKYPDIKL